MISRQPRHIFSSTIREFPSRYFVLQQEVIWKRFKFKTHQFWVGWGTSSPFYRALLVFLSHHIQLNKAKLMFAGLKIGERCSIYPRSPHWIMFQDLGERSSREGRGRKIELKREVALILCCGRHEVNQMHLRNPLRNDSRGEDRCAKF